MTISAPATTSSDVSEHVETLYRDGIVGLKGGFPREWIERMREDLEVAFAEAIDRPGGAMNRGPKRWYIEINPEQLRGFADFVSHPWITAMSEKTLGTDYRFVEVGFDVPFQGARNQPWHRDFRSPEATWRDHRITSLAFNLTGVDVTPDMGPFEIALGTHFDEGRDWKHGMFPSRDGWKRFETVAQRKFPSMGDISCRTALTIHRGTEHASATSRPVLILGVVAGEVANPEEHDLALTRPYHESLPDSVRRHLLCRIVDRLEPITQRHGIEGLEMGVEEEPPASMGG
jgi:hypothetical protein